MALTIKDLEGRLITASQACLILKISRQRVNQLADAKAYPQLVLKNRMKVFLLEDIQRFATEKRKSRAKK